MTDLPESPTSVTYSVTSANGYSALVTIRDKEFKKLTEKMAFAETWFDTSGYKPQIKGYPPREAKPVEYAPYSCPTCTAKVVKGSTKDGKTFEACETRKYDFKTKTSSGCSYIKWND